MSRDDGLVDEYPLGARIQFLRKKRGFRQVDLAKRCGITQGALSQIEKSQMAPSLGTLRAIARELRVHIAVLFAEDDVHVFDMKKLRTQYKKSGDFTPSLRRGLKQIMAYLTTLDRAP